MTSLDNPAGRLYQLLEQAKRIPVNTKARDAWAQLLNVTPGDAPLLFRRLARVYEIPDRLERQIRELAYSQDVDLELHLRWKGPIEALFSILTMASTWDHAIATITGDVMQNLEFCDHLLHRQHPERPLPAEQLKEIAEDIESLLGEILALPLALPVRHLIARHLRAILEAIEDYPIHGSPQVEYAVQAAVGTIFANSDVYIGAVGADGADREALERFLRGVWKVAAALSIVSSLLQLPSAVQHYLVPAGPLIETTPPQRPQSPRQPEAPDDGARRA